jgi:hypothetical protein
LSKAKKIVRLLLVVAVIFVSFSRTINQIVEADITTGLVGHWAMDESSWNGTSGEVLDSSGNSFNGTSSGGATTVSGGLYSRAGTFDGVDDKVVIADNATLRVNTFTLSAWIKPTSLPAASQAEIISKRSFCAVTENDFPYALSIGSSGAVILSRSAGNDFTTDGVSSDNGWIAAGNWYHILATFDGTENRIYINGGLAAMSFNSLATATNTQPVTIGQVSQDYLCGSAFPYNGLIDDVRIYNRALTNSDVRQLYGTTVPNPAQLVGHWTMDQASWNGTSGEVIDSSGHGHNGTAAGGADTTAGYISRAGNFTSSSQYITIPDSADLRVTLFTLSAWIKPSALPSNSGDVISKRSYCAVTRTDWPWALGINADGSVYLSRSPGDSFSSDGAVSSASLIQAGIWYHIAATYDGATNRVYVNGTQVASSSSTKITPINMQPVTIGRESQFVSSVGCTDNINYSGLIDDARIYNGALTSAQVASLAGSLGSGLVAHWKMDEASWNGTTDEVIDYSGYANHGTAVNGVTTVAGGYSNRAGSFVNSSHHYVSVPDDDSLDVTTAFSMSAWVYQTGAQSNGYRVLDKVTAGGDGTGFEFDTRGDTSGRRVRLCIATDCQAGNSQYSLNAWNLLTVTFDNSAVNFYLNGTPDGSFTSSNSTTYANALDVRIGGPHVGCSGACGLIEYFNGLIDDARIYNRALTGSEVSSLYSSGFVAILNATCPGSVQARFTAGDIGLVNSGSYTQAILDGSNYDFAWSAVMNQDAVNIENTFGGSVTLTKPDTTTITVSSARGIPITLPPATGTWTIEARTTNGQLCDRAQIEVISNPVNGIIVPGPGTDVDTTDDNTDVTTIPTTGTEDIYVRDSSNGNIVGRLTVDKDTGRDWGAMKVISRVKGEVGPGNESILHYPGGASSIPGIVGSSFKLYVRRSPSDFFVRVCPGTQDPSELTDQCSTGVDLRVGTTGQYTLAAVTLEGNDYWEISGVTGTGAITIANGIKDTMTRLQVSVASDHTIKYGTTNGLLASGNTTKIEFDPGGYAWNISSIVITDIELDDDGVAKTLAASAGADIWGVNINTSVDTVTFTAPTSGSDYIGAGSEIVVKIGRTASGGTNQILNPSTVNTYEIHMTNTGTVIETGEAEIPIIDDDTVNVTGYIDTFISFDIDTASTNINCDAAGGTAPCDSYGGATDNTGYVIDLGEMTTSTVNTSGTSVAHADGGTGAINNIWFDLSSNSDGGVVVTSYSLNNALSGPGGSNIPSVGSGEMQITAGSSLYGLQNRSSDIHSTVTGALVVSADCSASTGTDYFCSVGGTAGRQIFTTEGAVDTGRVQFRVGASPNSLNSTGTYTDQLTFIATATF